MNWATVILVYAVRFSMPFLNVFLVIVLLSADGHKIGNTSESTPFLWSQ